MNKIFIRDSKEIAIRIKDIKVNKIAIIIKINNLQEELIKDITLQTDIANSREDNDKLTKATLNLAIIIKKVILIKRGIISKEIRDNFNLDREVQINNKINKDMVKKIINQEAQIKNMKKMM